MELFNQVALIFYIRGSLVHAFCEVLMILTSNYSFVSTKKISKVANRSRGKTSEVFVKYLHEGSN